jgi:hypothetical protein
MRKLRCREVDFGVHKTINISSSRVMFRVHCTYRHGEVPFYHYIPLQHLSKGLSSDTNEAINKNVCTLEVDIPTYDFEVHKSTNV